MQRWVSALVLAGLASVALAADGDPVPLTALLPAGQSVSDYDITPDGTRVVYLADQDTAGNVELYITAIDGSQTPGTKLSIALQPGGGVEAFQITPDGTRVVYRVVTSPGSDTELRGVPLTGGASTLLYDGGPDTFEVSSDSVTVVFRAPGESFPDLGDWWLWTVPVTGGTADEIYGGAFAGETGVIDFSISPDSSMISVFFDCCSGMTGPVLTFVDFAGNGVQGGGEVPEHEFTSDSQHVIYDGGDDVTSVLSSHSFQDDTTVLRGECDVFSATPQPVAGKFRVVCDDGVELLSYPIDSEIATGLSGGQEARRFAITPDGQWTIWSTQAAPVELSRVPTLGGAQLLLNDPPTAGANIMAISTDGQRVIYRGGSGTLQQLYSVSINGGPIAKLSPTPVTGGEVTPLFAIDPTSDRVAFLGRIEDSARADMWAAPLHGGPPRRLSDITAPPAEEDVLISSDGEWVVYRLASLDQLFSVRLTVDRDADAVLDYRDCDHTDSTVWELPSEALNLTLTHSGGASGTTTLTWDEPAVSGGNTVLYDVLRTDQADGFAPGSGGSIVEVETGRAARTTNDADPVAGAFYYLARGTNVCGNGTLGQNRETP